MIHHRNTSIWTGLAAATVTWTIGLLSLTGTASAAETRSKPLADTDRIALVCPRVEQIEATLTERIGTLTDRQARLANRREAAVAAGRDQLVERIDRRSATLTERLATLQSKADRVPAWAAEHCPAD